MKILKESFLQKERMRKMITLKEIAEMCEVSVATVSNVINGKSKASAATSEKILKVIRETGYQPNYMAQGLRRQKTRTIALLVDEIAQFTSPPMVESVMKYCEKHGYRVIMRNFRLYQRWQMDWSEQREAYREIVGPAIQEALSAQVDGIIYIASHTREISYFSEDCPVPVVVAYAFSKSDNIPSVVIDDVKSAKEIMEYMLSKGHEKIGYISGKKDNHHSQQRLLGYQMALKEHQKDYDPELIYYGDWDRYSGYNGTKKLVEKGVSAIFCASDRIAGGVYDYLEEIGKKVGTDISVAGFDGELISEYFTPKLTTVKLPLEEIGHLSAKLMLDRLEDSSDADSYAEYDRYAKNRGQAVCYMIPGTFVERKSVGQLVKERN